MVTSQTTAAIFAAFSKFQAEVIAPAKNGKGNYGTYVLLDDLVLLRKELAKHGLGFTQEAMSEAEGVGVMTTIVHESGEWFTTEPLLLPLDKRTPQGAGSAVTYARRYSLAAALGVASEADDDGQHATDEQVAAEKASTARHMTLTKAVAKHKSGPAVIALLAEWGMVADAQEWAKMADAAKRELLNRLADDAWELLLAAASK
jgi:hypothetical protein